MKTLHDLMVIFLVLAFSCLATLVSQVPSITKPGFTLEDLSNVTLSGFPPGPSPIGPYLYPVRYSNVVLNFTHYWLNRYQSELDIERVIKNAIMDAGDPRRRRVIMDYRAEKWSSGSTLLMAIPKRQTPKMMTWGAWANALIGINQFRLAYPGLDIWFNILLQGNLQGQYIPIGLGSLYSSG